LSPQYLQVPYAHADDKQGKNELDKCASAQYCVVCNTWFDPHVGIADMTGIIKANYCALQDLKCA